MAANRRLIVAMVKLSEVDSIKSARVSGVAGIRRRLYSAHQAVKKLRSAV